MSEISLPKIEPLGDSINELMAGFVHDLNNLFACAIGSLGLARANDDNPAVQKEMIDVASTTIVRASELASLMMNALRGHDMQKEPINIQNLIQDAVKLAKQIIKADIELEIPQEPCYIQANRLAIINVVLNLLLNADRAITCNETIIIKCFAVDNTRLLNDPALVKIMVVNPRTKELLSTETAHKSILHSLRPHGIGLQMSCTIIEQHGGELTLSQEQDHTTIAEISLPMVQKPDVI